MSTAGPAGGGSDDNDSDDSDFEGGDGRSGGDGFGDSLSNNPNDIMDSLGVDPADVARFDCDITEIGDTKVVDISVELKDGTLISDQKQYEWSNGSYRNNDGISSSQTLGGWSEVSHTSSVASPSVSISGSSTEESKSLDISPEILADIQNRINPDDSSIYTRSTEPWSKDVDPMSANLDMLMLPGLNKADILGNILGGVIGKASIFFGGIFGKALSKGGTKLLEAPKMADHHIFSQQFRNLFKSKGINIDDFTVSIPQNTTHLKGIHGKGFNNLPGQWNSKWSEFIKNNPNATAKDFYQYAGKLMDEYGLSDLPIHPWGK